jgi:hypothetical protein
MLRSRNIALLIWLSPFCFTSILAYGQGSDPGQLRKAAPASVPQPASQPAGDGTPAADAPPIAANAPRINQNTRYEIIRNFETQLVYARTAFPMGTKGLLLKDGVITPNGEELRQSLTLGGPAVKPGDPAHIS